MGKMHQQESELIEWIKSDGFVHESIAIADTVNGRGLVACEDIPANTIILKVNRVGDLSTITTFVRSFQAINLTKTEAEYWPLVMQLLRRKYANASKTVKSSWHQSKHCLCSFITRRMIFKSRTLKSISPYCQVNRQFYWWSVTDKTVVFSESYDASPITWDDDQLTKLSPNVVASTKRIKQRLAELVKGLKLDCDMFTWAFCSVFTRSFAAKIEVTDQLPSWLATIKAEESDVAEQQLPEYAINCPLVDLANHGTNIKLLCWSGFDRTSQSMHLKTHKEVKKGTELCINYGFGKWQTYEIRENI